MLLVNGYMEVQCVLVEWKYGGTVCFGEWTCGRTMCDGEWTYGGNVVLVNGYMEVLCVLVYGHMEVMGFGE